MKEKIQISEEQAYDMLDNMQHDFKSDEGWIINETGTKDKWKQAGYIKQEEYKLKCDICGKELEYKKYVEEKPVFDELIGKRIKHKKYNTQYIILDKNEDGFYRYDSDYGYYSKSVILENFWIEGVNCL